VIDSDGFFDLEVQPKKVGVIGAGYIAVELAGVFNGLGTDTTLFVRKECALRNFDTMLSAHLDKNLKHAGTHSALYALLAIMSVCFSLATRGQSLTSTNLRRRHQRDGRLHYQGNHKGCRRNYDCALAEWEGKVHSHPIRLRCNKWSYHLLRRFVDN
jgi:cation diffusion facilitator CzcD-associated flavoprotein CzcO